MANFNSILVVCLGNICRSPTAEFMFRHYLPTRQISSAGLVACLHRDGTGWDMDGQSRIIAEQNGLDCPKHRARQLTSELVTQSDLILVMENKQRSAIAAKYPQALSKTMLLGQWFPGGSKEVPDPYRRSEEVYQQVYDLVDISVQAWVKRLS